MAGHGPQLTIPRHTSPQCGRVRQDSSARTQPNIRIPVEGADDWRAGNLSSVWALAQRETGGFALRAAPLQGGVGQRVGGLAQPETDDVEPPKCLALLEHLHPKFAAKQFGQGVVVR